MSSFFVSAAPTERWAEMTAYFDGCPDEWFRGKNAEERWHTMVFVAHTEYDTLNDFLLELSRNLPGGLGAMKKKRGKRKIRYRECLVDALSRLWTVRRCWINACTFQERVIRESRAFLCRHLDVGFEEGINSKGQRVFSRERVIESGLDPEIYLETQLLPLLAMGHAVLDQLNFYRKMAKQDHGFDELIFRLVTDHLPAQCEHLFLKIVNPDQDPHLQVTVSDPPDQPGDCLADNIASLFTYCLENPRDELSVRFATEPALSTLMRSRKQGIARDGQLFWEPAG